MVNNKGWNAIDERCSRCNLVTKKAIGINKQNLKKLFLSKPSIQDIMILVLICSVLLVYVQYTKEVTYYKEIIENKEYMCILNHDNLGFMEGILLNGTKIIIDKEKVNLKEYVPDSWAEWEEIN